MRCVQPVVIRGAVASRLLLVGLCAAIAVSAAAPAHATEPVSIRFWDIGLYRVGGAQRDTPAPETTMGFTRLHEQTEFQTPAQVVCARLGVTFGVSFEVISPGRTAPVSMEMRTRFPKPGLQLPDGRLLEASRFAAVASPGTANVRTFTFDEPFEIAAGIWTFEFYFDGRRLGATSFEIRQDCHAIS
jgi:hypothetical protein